MKIIENFSRRRSSLIPTQPSPPLKRKALLIGVQDANEIPQENVETSIGADAKKKAGKERNKEGILRGPHRDVLAMQQLLIDVYHYDPKDITVLIDDDVPDHIQPTKQNMIQKMIELVDGALPGDRFFFHFSGHATQQDTDSPEEEDRKDELICSSDGQTIQDNYLKELLVEPLPIGSTLVAVFDACHSCSLLDLKHFRCNRVYVPWRNKGRRQTDFPRNIIMRQNARIDVSLRAVTQAKRLSRSAITWKQTSIDQVLMSPVTPSADGFNFTPIKTQLKRSLSISTDTPRESWYGSVPSPIYRCRSPSSMYCTGRCRENPGSVDRLTADVFSLSSSKDCQRSWEDAQGSSMTQVLIKVLKNDPNPSLKDLLTLVSHDIHSFYLTLHETARKYKEDMKIYNSKRTRKKPKKARSVEMDNFQDPQISSPQPLDMSRRWYL